MKYIAISALVVGFLIIIVGIYKMNYSGNQAEYQLKTDVGIDTNVVVRKVPEFRVKVELSEKAQQRLEELNERVRVIVYFDGNGEAIVGEKMAPFREVYLGVAERTIEYGEVAVFNNIKFPKKDFDRLSSKDFYGTINVVSAREGHEDNLLDVETYIELISEFADTEILVRGKLIGE